MAIVKQHMQYLTNNETETHIQIPFHCHDKGIHRRCMFASRTLFVIDSAAAVAQHYLYWHLSIVNWAHGNKRQWNFIQNDKPLVSLHSEITWHIFPRPQFIGSSRLICDDLCGVSAIQHVPWIWGHVHNQNSFTQDFDLVERCFGQNILSLDPLPMIDRKTAFLWSHSWQMLIISNQPK